MPSWTRKTTAARKRYHGPVKRRVVRYSNNSRQQRGQHSGAPHHKDGGSQQLKQQTPGVTRMPGAAGEEVAIWDLAGANPPGSVQVAALVVREEPTGQVVSVGNAGQQ